MTNARFVSPDEIRSAFSAAMSAMYRDEVPAYGTLMSLVAQVNEETLANDPALKERLAATDSLARISEERHGAIRLGTPAELAMMRRAFAVMGMFPVGYYDLSTAGVPVHSTAFRPIEDESLKRNPFRVFTSLLRLDLIADEQLRAEAAAVLAELSDPARTDVAHAIATMGTASQDAVAIVASSLRARSGAFATRDSRETLGGVQPLVDIINRSDATVEKALLSNLEARDSALAEDIRSRMFTFADIVVLDDRDAQRVLRGIEIRVLALALKGASDEVAAVIRRNMTERNREVLEEESRLLGSVRVSQVEEARSEIVRTIRTLEASGDIRVRRGDEDEYVN